MTSIESDVMLITASGLFNEKWYRSAYPDVDEVGLSPIQHYLRYGAAMGRNPSPLFDAAAYTQENPDILVLGENPLVHYIRFREGLIPGADQPAGFKGEFRGYLDKIDSSGFSGWAVDIKNPGKAVKLQVFVDDEHFTDLVTSAARIDLDKLSLDGRRAGFAFSSPTSAFPKGTRIDVRTTDGWSLRRSPRVVEDGPGPLEAYTSHYLDAHESGLVRPVTVVVPVFNAHDAVKECLESLALNMSLNAEVLVIDDCSSDPRMAGMLESMAGAGGFRLLRNAENIGYTKTVNRGIQEAGENDVILLNSDTVVTERWIDTLRYCAYASTRVATVTALSNNAGAFSVPEFGVPNDVPAHLDHVELARIVTAATPGSPIEVPTGNGFCLYMRRAALDALGHFDETKYPRGYGEENDLCMRAYRAGWRNLVCDKAYVLHKRSQSFQGEKVALSKAGGHQLEMDYPEYRMLIKRFSDVQFTRLRRSIGAAIGSTAPSRASQCVMFVVSTQTGGTPQTNLDLMHAISDRYRCVLLRCDSKALIYSELVDGVLVEKERHPLRSKINPITHKSREYDRIVADLMYRHCVALLHIRHIAWHSLGLPAVARMMGIPVAYSFHDFYSVCPSLNLLDEELKFCGGTCTKGQGDCQRSLWPQDTLPRIKHGFVGRWQEMFSEFIASCDRFITTTKSAASVLESVYPQLGERVEIIPHGRDFSRMLQCASGLEEEGPIRVLVPGNIGPAKGSDLLVALNALHGSERFELHFLGGTAGVLRGIGVHHGTYDRSSFQEKVRRIRPTFGVVLSVCAETYCHTLTEMWACGLPVLGIDIGAVGDRIDASGGGWLVERDSSPVAVLAAMDAIASDPEEYRLRLDRIRHWQETEAQWNDTRTMSERYVEIYRELLDGSDKGATRHLALLYRRDPYVPATAYIRMLLPWRKLAARSAVQERHADVDWLLAGGAERIDGLVIQRNAVPAEKVGALLELLERQRVPYVYDIDDMLWEIPERHGDYAYYLEYRAAVTRLIQGAAMVLTSTEPLRAAIAEMNPRVRIVENGMDASFWQSPLNEEQREAVLASCSLEASRPRLLYMGTSTHGEDIRMISPAVEALLLKFPDLEVVQIGGGETLPGARLLDVPPECAAYPDFVTWFRIICSAAVVGLAPLEETFFNAMKSDIKALDYALAGLPAVFSDVVPYRDRITNGTHGILAENTTQAWVDAVTLLLSDTSLRDGIVAASREKALKNDLDRVEVDLRGVLADVYDWNI